MRILEFLPSKNEIQVMTYSPTLDQFAADANSEFSLSYDMSGSYQEIGEVAGVASGANAAISWPALNPDTEYEWYVTVNDGHSTTTGPVWSFTTTAGLAGEFDSDCDADGVDLVWLIGNPGSMDIGMFAQVFGTVGCP